MKDNEFEEKIITKIDKEKKLSESRSKNQLAGSYAKKRRMELNLTQGETSKGICSLSYISKVESNQIVPNERISSLLYEKLKMNKFEMSLLENSSEEMRDIIYNHFDFNVAQITNKYNEMVEREDNIVALLHVLSYRVITKDREHARKLAQKLSDYVSSMDDEMLAVYAYLTACADLLSGKYEEARELAEAQLHGVITNEKLIILLEEVSFSAEINLRRYSSALLKYDELKKKYTDFFNIIRLKNIRLKFFEVLFATGDYERIINDETILKGVPNDEHSDEILYIYGMSAYRMRLFSRAHDTFMLMNKNSKYFEMALPYVYLSMPTEREFLFDEMKGIEPERNSFYISYFVNAVSGKMPDDFFKTDLYMDTYANASFFEKEELETMEYEFYKDKKKYKEALAVLEKKNRKGNSLNFDLNNF